MRFTLIHLAALAAMYGRSDAAYTFGQSTVGAARRAGVRALLMLRYHFEPQQGYVFQPIRRPT